MYLFCRSKAESSEQATQTADKWVLIFKQDTADGALQALCVEAEAAAQGRFSGTCTRLYTGTVMKGISGELTCLRGLDTGSQQLRLGFAVGTFGLQLLFAASYLNQKYTCSK